MKIDANGVITSNDNAWVYELFAVDYICPRMIDEAMESNEDLEININSGGGLVFAGQEIYSKLLQYNHKVTINVTGVAASSASMIAMAGDEVNISPVGQIMIHNVSTLQQGDFHDMNKASEMLQGFNDSLANAYAKKTGKDKAEILNMMDKETWLTAEKAVELGFADAVIAESASIQYVASATTVLPDSMIAKIKELVDENKALKEETAKFDFEAFKQDVLNAIKPTQAKKAKNETFTPFIF
ncbi:head maturation protease, ClpP-related [Ligilactobacillus equi]|uniref:ATP-dependent Clp protease proteolytic subunit n=1 Tax=Ligilactobacillus equi DPC 6820 TaxID=1392007 RepID=V7HXE6_9LACO|nr:head maturation protease, ClpP-related [Ligilactobacillus equi]ETA73863.1 ATP-dependent Clp protease proteolytic subunit [Ligilactobacillus equi DPC 6820]